MSQSIRILLVEDNPDDEFLIRHELEKNDFELEQWTCITTAREFEEQLNYNWDIILSDFSLPHFSTFAALDLLRKHQNAPPLIVVTGSVDEETAVECLRRGAVDYLLKDRLQRLTEAIRQALENSHVRQAQLQSERKFRTVFNEALDAILVVHPDDDRILDANHATCRLFEYELSHLIGQSLEILMPSPDIMTSITDDLEDRPAIFMVQRFATRTGKLIPMDLTATMIPWDAGEAILVTLRDMTERLEITQTRHEAEKLAEQLQQANRLRDLRDKFIAMISHDLGSPLSSIMLAVDTLVGYWDRIDDYKRLQKIQAMNHPLGRMANLLDEIVSMGEIESEADIYKPVLSDFETFCREVHAELSLSLPSSHHAHFLGTGEAVMMYFDPHLMHRILSNLHHNAVKYSPQGGEIHWEIRPVNENEFIFSIRDQGIGIPPKDQNELFEPYKRASNVGKLKGTGLGLAIVKQAVELHGGAITLQSEVEKGCTFYIRLPRVRVSY